MKALPYWLQSLAFNLMLLALGLPSLLFLAILVRPGELDPGVKQLFYWLGMYLCGCGYLIAYLTVRSERCRAAQHAPVSPPVKKRRRKHRRQRPWTSSSVNAPTV